MYTALCSLSLVALGCPYAHLWSLWWLCPLVHHWWRLYVSSPQPFHKGPHFRGRGRGAQSAQAFSRGKSKVSPVLQQGTPKQSATSRSTTVKRLVKLRLSKHDSTSTSGVNSSYGYMSKSLVSAPKQKPALRRKTVLFHRKLAETNKRPKCTGNSLGDKNPFHQLSNSGSNSSLQLLKKPDGCDRPGNCRAASKESNCEGVTLSRPISEFNISCTEKRRRQPSGDKPKRTRFDPCESSDTAKQSLPADMVDYVDKNFSFASG